MSYCPEDGDRMEPLNDDFTLYRCPYCLTEWRYDDTNGAYAISDEDVWSSGQYG